jgi:hypothetical protein
LFTAGTVHAGRYKVNNNNTFLLSTYKMSLHIRHFLVFCFLSSVPGHDLEIRLCREAGTVAIPGSMKGAAIVMAKFDRNAATLSSKLCAKRTGRILHQTFEVTRDWTHCANEQAENLFPRW